MDDADELLPRGLLFILADGGPWAEMRCLDRYEPEPEDDEFMARFIVPDSDRLH